MKPLELLNLIAVFVAPIAAVMIGQFLQDRSEKRKDKMRIFQFLMTRRAVSWGSDLGIIDALNSIDIIFADDKNVRKCWAALLSEYDINPINLKDEDRIQVFNKQQKAQFELLKSMAENLGYKDKISEKNLQKPYYSIALDQQISNNIQYQTAVLQIAKMLTQTPMASNTKATQEDTTHANP